MTHIRKFLGATVLISISISISISLWLFFQSPVAVFKYPGNPCVKIDTYFSGSVLIVDKDDCSFKKKITYEHDDFSKLIRVDFDDGIYLFCPVNGIVCSPSGYGVSCWFETVLAQTKRFVFKDETFETGALDRTLVSQIANSVAPEVRQKLMDQVTYIVLGDVNESEWKSLKEFKYLSRVVVSKLINDQDIKVIANLNVSSLDLRNSDFELSNSNVLAEILHFDEVVLPQSMKDSVSGSAENVIFSVPFDD